MGFSAEYVAVMINSTIRMTTPLLFATLTAAVCAKVKVFNIAMEGTMLTGAFFAIVVNHYTASVALSILAATLSGVLLSALTAFIILKLKASAVVVGMAVNTCMAGLTSYLLYTIFSSRGVYASPSLVSMPKISLPVIKNIPVLSVALGNLTLVDYLAFLLAILTYIFLYKTVWGYRLRAIGINQQAAKSLGTPVERCQFAVFSLSGMFCGLAGCLLSMGTVTLFIENITSGRGYIAMAVNSLGKSHPLGVVLSSLFFGIFQSLGYVLQNTSLKTQFTSSIPYAATILTLIVLSIKNRYTKRKRMKGAISGNETQS